MKARESHYDSHSTPPPALCCITGNAAPGNTLRQCTILCTSLRGFRLDTIPFFYLAGMSAPRQTWVHAHGCGFSSGLNRTPSENNSSFPRRRALPPFRALTQSAPCRWCGRNRHIASSQTDRQRYALTFAAAGLFLRGRGEPRIQRCVRGVLSCVQQKGILPPRLFKCGAMTCLMMQLNAPKCRRSRCGVLAASGRKKQQSIGRITRAYSRAWRNTGSLATGFLTLVAWRSFVCSHDQNIRGTK